MKNRIKLFEAIRRVAAIRMIAIIALVAIIGFSMAACDNGSTGGGGGTTLVVRIVRIPSSGSGSTVVSGSTASLTDMWRLEVQFHTGDKQWGYWQGSSEPSTKWYLNGTEFTPSYEKEVNKADIPSASSGDKIKVQVTYQGRDSKGKLLSPTTKSATTTLTD